MRLLNTRTRLMEEFQSEDDIEYAILSHRWEYEEVSYQGMHNLDDNVLAKNGYRKIREACDEALSLGHQYIWVDTCCIDKTNKSELEEAINSMFRWYQRATVCLVYLCDVHSYPINADEFESSQWFTRGWTLQELLAPAVLRFYNSSWRLLGQHRKSSKQNPSSELDAEITDHIAKASGINRAALGGAHLLSFSISERMSWAAKRKTTRIEDQAYSLIGLFNVNMPLIYGMGRKAFIRLQEEIIKYSDDHTIFAWKGVTDENNGLLAPSVSCFADIPVLKSYMYPSSESLSYSMTNRGLSIELNLTPWAYNVYLATLNCITCPLGGATEAVGIFLYRLEQSGQYCRTHGSNDRGDLYIGSFHKSSLMYQRKCTVHIRQTDMASSLIEQTPQFQPLGGYQLLPSPLFDRLRDIQCNGLFDLESGIAQMSPLDMPMSKGRTPMNDRIKAHGKLVVIETFVSKRVGHIILGFDFDFAPVCVVTHKVRYETAMRSRKAGNVSQSQFGSDTVQRPLYAITCMEQYGWHEHSVTRAGFPVSELGIWAMKGDKSSGLRASLHECSHITECNETNIVLSVLISQNSISLGQKLWSVKISSTEANTSGTMKFMKSVNSLVTKRAD